MTKRQKPGDGFNDKNFLEPNSKKAKHALLANRWNMVKSEAYSDSEREGFRKDIRHGDWHKVPSSVLELYWGSQQKEGYRLNKGYNTPLILALNGEWTKLQTSLNGNDFKPKQFLATFESLSNRLKIKKDTNAEDRDTALLLIAKAGKTKLFVNILKQFPEIQPLANGYSEKHPLVVAASKNWQSFKKYLKDGTFKPKQFVDLMKKIDGIDHPYQAITKNVAYQNNTKCGDGFSVFEILYGSRQGNLLDQARTLALKEPINTLAYIGGVHTFKDLDNDENSYIALTLRSRSSSEEYFDPLFYTDSNNDWNSYNNSKFNEQLKDYFSKEDIDASVKSALNIKGFTNSVIFVEDSAAIVAISNAKDQLDDELNNARHCISAHIDAVKKCLEFSYEGIKSGLKNSFFGVTINKNDDLIDEVISYSLPKSFVKAYKP